MRVIRPVAEWMRSLGTTRWIPFEARTWIRPPLADHRLGVVCPHPRGVDHLFRPNVQIDTALQVAHPGADHSLALTEETHHPRSIRDRGAVGRRGADQGEGEPRVVDLGIPVLDRPREDVLAQRRHQPQRASPCEVAMVGDAARAAAHMPEGVVERDAGSDICPLPAEVV